MRFFEILLKKNIKLWLYIENSTLILVFILDLFKTNLLQK